MFFPVLEISVSVEVSVDNFLDWSVEVNVFKYVGFGYMACLFVLHVIYLVSGVVG